MKAYLVFGPESSGNRFVVRLLTAAGCIGDGCPEQRLDDQEFRKETAKERRSIAWYRSLPHGGKWADVPAKVRELRGYGYDVRALVMCREWYCTVRSQLHVGHVRTEQEAFENLQRAYPFIFGHLSTLRVSYVMVPYASLVYGGPRAVRVLFDLLGLPAPVEYEAPVDANNKWYDDYRPLGPVRPEIKLPEAAPVGYNQPHVANHPGSVRPDPGGVGYVEILGPHRSPPRRQHL